MGALYKCIALLFKSLSILWLAKNILLLQVWASLSNGVPAPPESLAIKIRILPSPRILVSKVPDAASLTFGNTGGWRNV
jgi:hypothetical protein